MHQQIMLSIEAASTTPQVLQRPSQQGILGSGEHNHRLRCVVALIVVLPPIASRQRGAPQSFAPTYEKRSCMLSHLRPASLAFWTGCRIRFGAVAMPEPRSRSTLRPRFISRFGAQGGEALQMTSTRNPWTASPGVRSLRRSGRTGLPAYVGFGSSMGSQVAWITAHRAGQKTATTPAFRAAPSCIGRGIRANPRAVGFAGATAVSTANTKR